MASTVLDEERIKDFSSVLMDLHNRQEMMVKKMIEVLQQFKQLQDGQKKLNAEVIRLQRVVALNNVIILCRRNKEGTFEPLDIERIAQEVTNRIAAEQVNK